MKRPSKKQIQELRIALGMTGLICINDSAADLILTTQNEIKRIGGKFSVRDGVHIATEVNKTYNKAEQ